MMMMQILALPALRIRVELVGDQPASYGKPVTCADDIWSALKCDVERWDRERFLTVALDTGKRIIGIEEVSVGSLNASIVHPREVFKALILANAHSFICAHNHPSGSPEPSAEDAIVTRKLAEAGTLLGIPLVDHIVLAADGFYSFQQNGRL